MLKYDKNSLVGKIVYLGTATVMAVTLYSCTTTQQLPQPRPEVFVYPSKGQSLEQTIKDKRYCKDWADEQVTPGQTPAQPDNTIKGAGAGVLIGGILGAIVAGRHGVAPGALIGGGTGAAAGASQKGDEHKYQKAFDRAYGLCMREMGYGVE